MVEKLPDPPIPPDANLRGLKWMPLDVLTLPDSDLWMKSTGDEAKAAVTLWCKAWMQLPAGSLPNDDQVLAGLSKAKNWKRLRRDVVLRGWVLHSDGRYYHPVITEKVIEALPMQLDYSERRKTESSRKTREREDRRNMFARLREAGRNPPPWNVKTGDLRLMIAQLDAQRESAPTSGAPVTPDVTPPVTHRSRPLSRPIPDKTRPDNSQLFPGGVAPTPAPKPKAAKKPVEKPEAPTNATWAAYALAFEDRYKVAPTRNAQVNGLLANFVSRIPAAEAPAIAAFYVSLNDRLYVEKTHSVRWLLNDAEALRTRFHQAKAGHVTGVTGPVSARAARAQEALGPLAKHVKTADKLLLEGEKR